MAYSVDFAGDTGRAITPASGISFTGNFSITIVFTPTAVSTLNHILGSTDGTTAGSHIEVTPVASGANEGKILAYVGNYFGGGITLFSTTTISLDTEQTLVISRTGSTVSMSLNGDTAVTGTFSGTLNIGRFGRSNAVGANEFKLHNFTIDNAGSVTVYDCDEGSGTTISATSGSGPNFNMTGFPGDNSQWINEGGGTTPVENSSSLTWSMQESVSQASALVWTVAQSVDQSSALTWGVTQAVEQSSAPTWDVQEAIVNGAVLGTEIGSGGVIGGPFYIGEGVVSNSFAPTWDLIESVAETSALLWNVREATENGFSTTWSVIESVEGSAAFTWGVLNEVSAADSLTWSVLQSVDAGSSLQWSVIEEVSAEAGLSWSIGGSAEATLTPVWGVLNSVSQSAAIDWSILESVGVERNATFGDASEVYGGHFVWTATNWEIEFDAIFPTEVSTAFQRVFDSDNADGRCNLTVDDSGVFQRSVGGFAGTIDGNTLYGQPAPLDGAIHRIKLSSPSLEIRVGNILRSYLSGAFADGISVFNFRLVDHDDPTNNRFYPLDESLSSTASSGKPNSLEPILDAWGVPVSVDASSPVLGSEWTDNGDGSYSLVNDNTGSSLRWTNVDPSKIYRMRFDAVIQPGSRLKLNGAGDLEIDSSGSYEVYLCPEVLGRTDIFFSRQAAAATATIGNVQIDEMPTAGLWYGRTAPDIRTIKPDGAPLSPSWSTQESVSSGISVAWNTTNSCINSLSVVWDLGATASNGFSPTWDVRNSAENSASLTWDLRQSALSALLTEWDVLNQAESPLSIQWNLVGSPENGLSLEWTVLEEVGQQMSVSWDTRNEVAQSRAFVWEIVNQVVNGFSAQWEVVGEIVGSAELQWSIRNQVVQTLTSEWDVVTGASASLTVTWDSIEVSQNSIALLWTVQSDTNQNQAALDMTPSTRLARVMPPNRVVRALKQVTTVKIQG